MNLNNLENIIHQIIGGFLLLHSIIEILSICFINSLANFALLS